MAAKEIHVAKRLDQINRHSLNFLFFIQDKGNYLTCALQSTTDKQINVSTNDKLLC